MSFLDFCVPATGVLLAAGVCLLIAGFVQTARHGGLEPIRFHVIVGGLIGALVVVVGICWMIDHHRFLSTAKSELGTVIIDQEGRKRIQFAAEGKTIQIPVERLAPGGLSSDRGLVVYPPGQPERARLRGLMTRRYPAYWLMVGMGAIFTFFGLIAWRPSLIGGRSGALRA